MSSPLVHIEVVGKDGKKLQEFFTGLFGWEINADNPMNYGVFNLSDQVGGGIGPAPEGYDGHATFYIGVDDVAAALKKAESLGGKTVMEASAVPGGPTIGQFTDPEGHLVGLFQNM
jgi:predicted enzyme related to lactoylglutathione lyase